MSAAPNGGRILLEEEARHQELPLNVVQDVNSFYLIKRIVRKLPVYTITTFTSVEEELQKGELGAYLWCNPRSGRPSICVSPPAECLPMRSRQSSH